MDSDDFGVDSVFEEEPDNYSDGSCYSQTRRFDRFSTRTLPVRRKRYHSYDKSYVHNDNTPGQNSIYPHEPCCYNRSPSKRKRDLFSKRRSYSSSSLPTRVASAPCELSSMAESDENETDVDLFDTDQKQSDSTCSSSRHSSIDSCYSELSSLPDRRRSSCNSCCSGIDGGIYSVFDIVGESFEARFPWQRDVATQCNIVIDCNRDSSYSRRCSGQNLLDSPTSQQLLRRKNLGQRPHSIGCVENELHDEELLRVRFEHSQQPRKSDSCLQVSPRSQRRRSSPFYLDDFGSGSVSDLGSISEIPDFERENSIITDGEVSSLCRELRQIAINVQYENETISILPSPRVSPLMFLDRPEKLNGDEDKDDSRFLRVPKKTNRRANSLPNSSESDTEREPSPPVSRRGRRSAIVDMKNFGDVSPSTLSPEVSPCNSCDEGDNASNLAERIRRRRSSVEMNMSVYPGDLLVQDDPHKKLLKRNTISDFYPTKNGTTTLTDDSKKRQSFSLLKLMKTRSKESLPRLEDILSQITPSEFKDNHLTAYKTLHWSDLVASSDKQQDEITIPDNERKRREAVWELFKSECVFLIDHLMVLKHCFMEPLKKVQVEGHLMFAEPHDIFGNLDELCYVSYTFCKDFISALVKDMSSTDFGSTNVLVRAFERFTTHSRDGGVYHTYCLNYVNALGYLDQLRRHDDFADFEKWCTSDQRCNRLQLNDLLVAPMQHCTKFPLLLLNIRKYTQNSTEQELLSELREKVEFSLKKMEDKLKWVKNYERLQDIQSQLVWPSISDIDPRALIPDFLKTRLSRQPCERLICSPGRQLVHEGFLTLVDSAKSNEMYVFLFDDILLITKPKKLQRKKHSLDSNYMKMQTMSTVDKGTYVVIKQPMSLDRLSLHDIGHAEAVANGLKNAFVLVQISRYQQVIGVYTFQCPNEMMKVKWMDKMTEARAKIVSGPTKNYSFLDKFKQSIASPPRSPPISSDYLKTRRARRPQSLKSSHGKSLSMDAVYL
ncbi:uncharacterized protein LOC143066243 isoform X2 [Mytilus galloprovincialis]|uniref:uncharacterized protein LOC143066243 isoform X2 n=1 Tax=Mytilus galloprovincialis TaxID=29158 RepID=UPI003F7CB988